MIGAEVLASGGLSHVDHLHLQVQCICDTGRDIFWQLLLRRLYTIYDFGSSGGDCPGMIIGAVGVETRETHNLY